MTALRDLLAQDGLADVDPAPLYLRVQARIREAIDGGRLQPGAALPPERELATALGISRVTIRRALGDLAKEGLLIQRHGSGTFVAPPPSRKIEQPLSRLTSFSEDMAARRRVASSRILDTGVGYPTAEESMIFASKTGDRVSRLKRLRIADDVPMALELTTIPQAYLEDPAAVGPSLYAALARQGAKPVRALERLAAENLAPAEAELLGVPVNAAALRIERIGYLDDGRVVEFTRSYYRGDAYDFVAELTLGAPP